MNNRNQLFKLFAKSFPEIDNIILLIDFYKSKLVGVIVSTISITKRIVIDLREAQQGRIED